MKRSAEATLDDPKHTIVRFNVGGVCDRCATTLHTLRNSSTHFPDSVLAWLFGDDTWREQLDPRDGTYFVDRDVQLFEGVLKILRHPHANPVSLWDAEQCLLEPELEFWGLAKPQLLERPKAGEPRDELMRLGAELRQRHKKEATTMALAMLKNVVHRSHHMYVYVPREYVFACTQSTLEAYLRDHRMRFQHTIERALGPCETLYDLRNYEDSDVDAYVFDDVRYETAVTPAYIVRIRLMKLDKKTT